MRLLWKWIATGALIANIVAPLISFAAVAEETDCCIYSVSSNAIAKIDDAGWGSEWFEGVTPLNQCKPAANVVAIAKYGSLFDAPVKKSGVCSSTTEFKNYAAEMSTVYCYIARDAGGKIKQCYDEPKTTNALQKSVYIVTKNAAPSDQITLENTPCNKLSACQAYNKAKADADVDVAKLDAERQKQIAETGVDSTPWTRDECLSVKGMDGAPKNVWLPPKKTPDVQIGNFCYVTPMRTDLEIAIGEKTFVAGAAQYINTAYKYAIGLAVLFAVVTIIYAGFQWMLSGVADKVQSAKDKIQSAVLGLLLILGAYTLLNTINPQLTELRTPPIQAIRPSKLVADGKAACVPDADPKSSEGCAKHGADFFCKPTVYGFKEACAERMKTFVAVMSAPAAIALGGAVLAEAGLFSGLVQGGARQWMTTTVECMLTEDKENVPICMAGGGLTGKGKMVLGAAAAVGIGAGAIALLSDNEKDPVQGYCVQGAGDHDDGMMCSYDSECASRKCLISKITCGGQNYGVCTSGKPREPCSTENGKYGCLAGASCVNNGFGVNKVGIGIGFCSDGTLGMACGEKASCKSGLECIKGYCRENGFFDPETGLVQKFAVGKPQCILATECQPENICSSGDSKCTASNMSFIGCIKPPFPDGSVPARLLLGAKAGALDGTYFRELLSTGTCIYIDDKHKAAQYASGVSNDSYCFANFRPYDGYLKKILGVFTNNQNNSAFTVPQEWKNGVEIAFVGCSAGDVCRVDAEKLNAKNLIVSGGRASVAGACVSQLNDSARIAQAGVLDGSLAGGAVWFSKDGKYLTVEAQDKKFMSIGLPTFSDLASILYY